MYNVMSMDAINRDMELLDKLDTVLENAMFKFELVSLTEATNENGNKADSKEKSKIGKFINTTWVTFCEKLLDLIDNIRDRIMFIIRSRTGGKVTLRKEMTVSKYATTVVPGRVTNIINQIKASSGDYSSDPFGGMEADLKRFMDEKITLRAGSPININGLYSVLVGLKKDVKSFKKLSKVREKDISVLNLIRSFYKDIISDIRSIVANTNTVKQDQKEGIYINKAIGDQFDKSAKNESIEIPYGMSRNEYIASIMLEAADLLKDDVVRDSSEVKEFSDIPEETPVKQDDYETSVVGGDDEKPDLEEIKDLCDNDPEVVKLLTDDEDKSVTVDSDGETNTESAFDFFNLDF